MAVMITANNAEFNRAMKQSQTQLGAFEGSVRGMRNLIGQAFGAYTLYRGLEYGIRTIAQFERQMDTVAAITGATGSEFQKLEEDARRLGRTTEFTATQVAGLQTEFGRLGFSNREIIESTEATINLATATGENLSRSAEIAGSTLRAFNLDASNMQRVTDVMSSSFNKSALALDSFADGIKYVAPVAHSVNVSLEETTAMLAVLADAGIKGSQAGTSLRRIFTLLTDDGRPLQERLAELAKAGITLADANDEVGLYAQTALLVLARENEQVKQLTETFRNANGETQKMADIMRDNLIGDWNKFTSALESATLEGGKLNSVLRAIVQTMTVMVGGGNEFHGPDPDAIPGYRQLKEFFGFGGIGDSDSEWTKKVNEWKKRRDQVNEISNSTAAPTSGAPKVDEWAMLHKSALAQDNTPLQHTIDQYNQYEAALLKGLAAQEQFSASNLKLSQSFEQATTATSKHLEKIGDEKKWENVRDNMQKTADSADMANMRMVRGFMAVGDAIGDAMVGSIVYGESFVKNLTRQMDQAVRQLYRLAVAYMIEKSIQNSGPFPIAGIAMATAGVIAIRGLFAGIQRSEDAHAAGMTVQQYKIAQRADGSDVNFRIRGADLVGTISNHNRVSGRTGT